MARAATRKIGKTGRPSSQEAEQIDARLLDVAATLFMANGYAETTIEKIARAARASTKTIYSRYDNKAEVLAAVIKRLIDQTLQGNAFTLAKEAGDARSTLRDLGLRFATLASDPQTTAINRLVISEAARFPELALAYRQGPERARLTVRAALEQLASNNKLPALDSFDAAATIFFDMATSTPRMQSLLGSALGPEEMSRHVETAVGIFLAGMGSAS